MPKKTVSPKKKAVKEPEVLKIVGYSCTQCGTRQINETVCKCCGGKLKVA